MRGLSNRFSQNIVLIIALICVVMQLLAREREKVTNRYNKFLFQYKVFRFWQFLPFLFFILSAQDFLAQQFLITNGTASACSGQFLDDSGTTGSYSNTNYTYTLCSSTPGQAVSLLFQGVSLGVDSNNPANSDYLSIYDSDTVNPSALIGTYTGSTLQGQTIQASFQNTSGCLTFVFQNGSAANGAGWEAAISCYNPCNKPTAVVTTSGLQAAPDDYGVMACAGETVHFSAQNSTTPSGTTLANYTWNFGDGSGSVITSNPTIDYTYEEHGQYLVHLTVTNNTGCSSTNATQYSVMVSPRPHFVGLPDIDPGPHLTCSNESQLSFDAGLVTHASWNAVPPLVVSQPLYLPDVLNVQFISTLTFDEFPAGASITSCSDLEYIYVNMEHAFLGDLDIWIECPNGTTVNLTHSGAGFAYLGEPFSGDSPTPGVGWDYYWSPTATNGTWLNNAPSTPPTTTQTLPSGTYEADGDLCNLVGCPLNGDWSIHLVDNFSSSNGYLFSWGLGLGQTLFTSLPTFTPTTTSSSWSGPFISGSPQGSEFSVHNPSIGTFDYTYHVVTNYGCTFDSIIQLSFHDPAVITAGPDKNYSCNPVILEAGLLTSTPYTYQWQWSPTIGLSNPNIANPTVSNLTQTTNYTVTVTPIGYPECAQTDMVTVNVVPSVTASLQDSFHGCAGTAITLPPPAISGGLPPVTIEWIGPNGQHYNQSSISVIPEGVEIYCAVVTDGCNQPDTLCTLVSTPNPVPASFTMDDNAGCEPFNVLMTSDYTELQYVSNMVWHFDDGEEAEVLASANHQYNRPGVYYPWLEITDIYGCVYADTSFNPVLVWEKPKPDFKHKPDVALIPDTEVAFENKTSGGLYYEWQFGEFDHSNSVDTTVIFPLNPAFYPVMLFAENQYGCRDSIIKMVEVRDDLIVFIPNSFTPDGDGVNDVWQIRGSGFQDFGYHIRVFNRWGDLVFESNDPDEAWVGDSANGEYYYVPDGTYTYRLEVVDTIHDIKRVFTGSVNLLR